MRSYTYVRPRHDLPDDWASELKVAVATRPDIRNVYWVTTLYNIEEGEVAQDEIHVELVEPPAERAPSEQFQELPLVIPAGPVWTISPETILSDVRIVGLRIA